MIPVNTTFLTRRAFSSVLSIFILLSISFILFRLLPGDPISLMFRDPRLTQDQLAYLREKFGLNKPLWEQYFIYLWNTVRGDLGISFYYKQPVTEILLERIVNTLMLLIPATIVSILLGVLTGVVSAWRHGSLVDKVVSGSALVLYTLPTYWLGGLLILASINYLHLPVTGMRDYGVHYSSMLEHLYDLASHMILPFITLVLVNYGGFTLLVRASMLDVLGEDYIRTYYAVGFREGRILFKYGLKNAMLPTLTAISIAIATSVSGAVLTETIFAWPGIGRLIYEAVYNRDYPLLQGAFLVIAVSVVLANLIADLLYGLIDPRVRT
ncbi:ABC-type dipeptide/oligopeptide/nickel transport system, permease component [Desulfurococcus amylolyticus 1221n]|uniref:ABC-type dipeptide/oligopeptide/nickel transport system, permease component n=1 Tax=Desulfurococcus amylolyticus (strain DSM 18924 / JCM 16383 / VKM B-2413 / 1221n) TaxID=490899 RepID=B8D511_DESA1|nr:ABC-type dipeptide/oligopeptide/nickel transport system, permease component [Desulfurococcus amylolyticus 1221n]